MSSKKIFFNVSDQYLFIFIETCSFLYALVISNNLQSSSPFSLLFSSQLPTVIAVFISFLFLFLFIMTTVATPPQFVYSLYFGDTISIIENINFSSPSVTQLAATENGNVYVVWVDKKNNNSTNGGDTDIAFKWSKDAGNTFSSKKLSRGLGTSSLSPQLAATENGNVYVVWVDKKNTNSTNGGDTDIAFKWSKDDGNTFSSKKLSRGLNASSLSPQLAGKENGNVYVVWPNNFTQFKEILGNNSIFGETININNDTNSNYPQIAATNDGNIYIIWIANKNNIDNEKTLYFKRISNFLFD